MSFDDLGDLRKLTKPQNYPVENMCVGRFGNTDFRIGTASMQGFRNNMEDFFIIKLNLSQHPTVGLFGIFDGHNGTIAAQWFSENIYTALDRLPHFSSELIQKTLFELDEEYLKVTENLTSGTTATFCLVEKIHEGDDYPGKSHKVTICHLGDSRLYIAKYGTADFIQSTSDHKPANVTEKQRVITAGGMVINGRIDSTLAVSRALGDHCYKCNRCLPPENQKVIALPDISISFVGKEEYLFICCDGVLEPRFAKNGPGIFTFLNESFNTSITDTAQILSDLIRELLQSGGRDNMTAMIIEFKDGTDYNRGTDFIAGEYYEEYGNLSYMNAYKSNCEMNGKTIDEVRALWFARKELEERKKEESSETLKKND